MFVWIVDEGVPIQNDNQRSKQREATHSAVMPATVRQRKCDRKYRTASTHSGVTLLSLESGATNKLQVPPAFVHLDRILEDLVSLQPTVQEMVPGL